jgi:hypothetical protein
MAAVEVESYYLLRGSNITIMIIIITIIIIIIFASRIKQKMFHSIYMLKLDRT